MRVLITGGAGFIGSHLAEKLLQNGADLLVLDNFRTGRRDTLTSSPRLQILEGTIADGAFVDRAFDEWRPDFVVHAAASYKDPQDWAEDSRTNVLGTVHVVKAAQRVGVRRFLYFQTALCYGLHPIEQPVTLNHPLRPTESSYAISKTAAETYIALSGLDFVSLRLANVYGPRNLSGPLPTFYQRLKAGKPCFVMDTRRDFVFVKDLIEVAFGVLTGKGRKGCYHVSSGKDYAIKDLFDSVVRAMSIRLDREVEVHPRSTDDAPTILLDPSATEADFGWKASTTLDAGVPEAIAWYEKHGVGETFTHLKPEGLKS